VTYGQVATKNNLEHDIITAGLRNICTRPTTWRFLSKIHTCLHVENVVRVDSFHQKINPQIRVHAFHISGNLEHLNASVLIEKRWSLKR
jgi:hypothetical protein